MEILLFRGEHHKQLLQKPDAAYRPKQVVFFFRGAEFVSVHEKTVFSGNGDNGSLRQKLKTEVGRILRSQQKIAVSVDKVNRNILFSEHLHLLFYPGLRLVSGIRSHIIAKEIPQNIKRIAGLQHAGKISKKSQKIRSVRRQMQICNKIYGHENP